MLVYMISLANLFITLTVVFESYWCALFSLVPLTIAILELLKWEVKVERLEKELKELKRSDAE